MSQNEIKFLNSFEILEDILPLCQAFHSHLTCETKYIVDGEHKAFHICSKNAISTPKPHLQLLKCYVNDLHSTFGNSVRTFITVIGELITALQPLYHLVSHRHNCLGQFIQASIDSVEVAFHTAQSEQVIPTCSNCNFRSSTFSYSRYTQQSSSFLCCQQMFHKIVHCDRLDGSLVESLFQYFSKNKNAPLITVSTTSTGQLECPRYRLFNGALLPCSDFLHRQTIASRGDQFIYHLLLVEGNLQMGHRHLGLNTVNSACQLTTDSFNFLAQSSQSTSDRWIDQVKSSLKRLNVNGLLVSGTVNDRLKDALMSDAENFILVMESVGLSNLAKLSEWLGVDSVDYVTTAQQCHVTPSVRLSLLVDDVDFGISSTLCHLENMNQFPNEIQTLICFHVNEDLGAVGIEKWLHEYKRVLKMIDSTDNQMINSNRKVAVLGGGEFESHCAKVLRLNADKLASCPFPLLSEEKDCEFTQMEHSLVLRAIADALDNWSTLVQRNLNVKSPNCRHQKWDHFKTKWSIWRWAMHFIVQCVSCQYKITVGSD